MTRNPEFRREGDGDGTERRTPVSLSQLSQMSRMVGMTRCNSSPVQAILICKKQKTECRLKADRSDHSPFPSGRSHDGGRPNSSVHSAPFAVKMIAFRYCIDEVCAHTQAASKAPSPLTSR